MGPQNSDAPHPVLQAIDHARQRVAEWRHEAAGDRFEYEKRDKLLLKLEILHRELALAITGSPHTSLTTLTPDASVPDPPS